MILDKLGVVDSDGMGLNYQRYGWPFVNQAWTVINTYNMNTEY